MVQMPIGSIVKYIISILLFFNQNLYDDSLILFCIRRISNYSQIEYSNEHE